MRQTICTSPASADRRSIRQVGCVVRFSKLSGLLKFKSNQNAFSLSLETGFPYPTANNLIGPASIFANAMINPNLSPEVEAEIEGQIIQSRSFSRLGSSKVPSLRHVTNTPNFSPAHTAGLATATHSFSRRPGVNITRVERKSGACLTLV